MSTGDSRRERIVAIASEIVASKMATGEIARTDEAIREAMPAAVKFAREVYDAAMEYVS
jgi:hypothetical protein